VVISTWLPNAQAVAVHHQFPFGFVLSNLGEEWAGAKLVNWDKTAKFVKPVFGKAVDSAYPRRATAALRLINNRRRTSRDAAHLVRAIVANHDEQARTAHHIAAETPDPGQLPDRVQWVLDRRAKAVATRRNHYQAWCRQSQDWAIDRHLSRDQQLSRSHDQSRDYGPRPLTVTTLNAGLVSSARNSLHNCNESLPARFIGETGCPVG
jgi:hypothetical protein